MITRLRCINPAAAIACEYYLANNGVRDVEARGSVVTVPDLSPRSVMLLAEKAFEFGWAHDEDCARIIADMSAGDDKSKEDA